MSIVVLLSGSFLFFALFSVRSLFFVQFPAPIRSAIFFAELRCRTFRIFHRNFVMPEADVTRAIYIIEMETQRSSQSRLLVVFE